MPETGSDHVYGQVYRCAQRNLVTGGYEQPTDTNVPADRFQFADNPSLRIAQANRKMQVEPAIPSLFGIWAGGWMRLVHFIIVGTGKST